MENYACISSDILAQNHAKQFGLESSGAGGAAFSSHLTHHVSTIQQQQDAASTLKEFNNNDIFAWLKLARSTRHIEPIPEQRPGEGHLSQPHVLALSTLKDCQNERLLDWLELARLHCQKPTSHAPQRSFQSGSGSGIVIPSLRAQPKQSPAEATLGTDATATGLSQLIPNPWRPHLGTDDLPGHTSGRSVNSTRSNKAENHYWCTVCEELKSFKDNGNWKKHEKEHETIFVCGLDDAAESSRAGQSYNSKSYTCKRRDIMVNHLNKSHGITETQEGRDLADQWRHTLKKQAWSCGFCISLFLTFQDRLKHVDVEHFRRHQSIHEWDLNKVILGLLQQPKMQKVWQTRTAFLPPWVDPENLVWDKVTAKDLRAALEIGPSNDHHANTLADAAYSASNPNEESWPLIGTTHANRLSDATAQAGSFPSLDYIQPTPALTSDSDLHHRPNSAITGSTAHLVSGDPSFAGPPTSAFPLGNTLEPWMPASDTEGRVDRNGLIFNPSQSWTSASEPGIFLNGYEQSGSCGGRGEEWSTPNWYDN